MKFDKLKEMKTFFWMNMGEFANFRNKSVEIIGNLVLQQNNTKMTNDLMNFMGNVCLSRFGYHNNRFHENCLWIWNYKLRSELKGNSARTQMLYHCEYTMSVLMCILLMIWLELCLIFGVGVPYICIPYEEVLILEKYYIQNSRWGYGKRCHDEYFDPMFKFLKISDGRKHQAVCAVDDAITVQCDVTFDLNICSLIVEFVFK